MKNILLIICLSFSTLLMADSTSSLIPTIPDSAKATFHQVYQDVKEGLTGLAEGLKVGVQEVWRILVLKQFVVALYSILTFVLGIVLAIIVCGPIRRALFKTAKDSEADSDFPWRHAAVVLLFIPCACMILIPVFEGPGILLGIMVPEYGAIQEIMSFVKQ